MHLKLTRTIVLNKNGEAQYDQFGNLLYAQDDTMTLYQLVQYFAWTKHPAERRAAMKLTDRLQEAWRQEADEITFSDTEAALFRAIIREPEKYLQTQDTTVQGMLNNIGVQRTLLAMEEQFG